MLYEMCASMASVQVYAVQTELRQLSMLCIAWQNFLENNFADLLNEVQVKIILISPSRWQRFVTATSVIVKVEYLDKF